MMKKKPIKTVKLSEIDINTENKINLKSMYIPQKTKETQKIEGTDDEIAEKVARQIDNFSGDDSNHFNEIKLILDKEGSDYAT